MQCVHDDAFEYESPVELGTDRDLRYTEKVMSHELKVFLTEHLDDKAAEIIENEEEDGLEAWKVLNLHFELKSLMSLPNLKKQE